MNARSLVTLVAVAVVCPAVASAAPPPVRVEVIVDGDDSEDFFAEPDAKTKKDKKADGVRKRAAAADKELDEATGVRVQTKRDADENSNTQVVNVVIQGSDTSAASSATAAPAASDKAATSAPAAKPAAAAAKPADAEKAGCDCEEPIPPRKGWWDVPSYVSKNDVMFGIGGAWGSAGGLASLYAEGMFEDQWGIYLKGQFAGFDQADLGEREGIRDFLSEGRWGVRVDPSTVRRGHTHVTDFGVAWHLREKKRFEINPTFAISHFGYDIRRTEGDPLRGGSVLLRLGVVLNYHWRRVFFGLDVGWYPYELVRYEITQNLEAEVGNGRNQIRSVTVRDRFDEERYITSAHIGLRF